MHNTTIESDELYENGRKKKMPKCYVRIYYIKTEKNFIQRVNIQNIAIIK